MGYQRVKYVAVGGLMLMMTGCVKTTDSPIMRGDDNIIGTSLLRPVAPLTYAYEDYIRPASMKYGIDENLIRSIIEVESGFNPRAISKSNAIGLMQIKSDTSGRDVFRLQGRAGAPTINELMDPARNIEIGTAYLNILKNQHLDGISDPQTMHYAMIVAYVNGAGALLRTFSSNRQIALDKINRMTPVEFYKHVKYRHPAEQAQRYLDKVTTTYYTGSAGKRSSTIQTSL